MGVGGGGEVERGMDGGKGGKQEISNIVLFSFSLLHYGVVRRNPNDISSARGHT